ncbi:MAG: phytanoyl-CoA dioxygenase family protein, partial [Thermomicrobiales bacterium]
MAISPSAPPAESLYTHDAYRLSVDEFIAFRRNGFLVVRGLVSPEEIEELKTHTTDLMQGNLPEQQSTTLDGPHSGPSGTAVQALAAPPAHLTPEEKADYFLRLHMLHRQLELHERFLLHPRVLDVLQALIGPDLLALQTMLFLKGPGKPGQGWHQDTYYIPTHPDTLCGAWIAIDDCDEQNGALWYAKGSQHEPVYPPRSGYGFGDHLLEGVQSVDGVSNPNDADNDLARIADRYDQLLVSARSGDVVFFGGHVLHRSKKNWSSDRFRRSFVGHYCNARSFTQWGREHGEDVDDSTLGTNQFHILARGNTHLPFAKPQFGTFCAAILDPEQRRTESEFAAMMMGDM